MRELGGASEEWKGVLYSGAFLFFCCSSRSAVDVSALLPPCCSSAAPSHHVWTAFLDNLPQACTSAEAKRGGFTHASLQHLSDSVSCSTPHSSLWAYLAPALSLWATCSIRLTHKTIYVYIYTYIHTQTHIYTYVHYVYIHTLCIPIYFTHLVSSWE